MHYGVEPDDSSHFPLPNNVVGSGEKALSRSLLESWRTTAPASTSTSNLKLRGRGTSHRSSQGGLRADRIIELEEITRGAPRHKVGWQPPISALVLSDPIGMMTAGVTVFGDAPVGDRRDRDMNRTTQAENVLRNNAFNQYVE